MLAAFKARPIVELKQRDKSKIDAILSYGDRLLVGLNTGSLRVYRVNDIPSEAESSESPSSPAANGASSISDGLQSIPKSDTKPVDLLREVEKFSRRSIEQLAIIKEANLLVCLTDNYVFLYDLQSFSLQEQLTKTKGAIVFAVTSNIVKDSTTAVPSIVSRLAVAVKRKLLLWSWQDSELLQDTHELLLAAPARTLTWSTGTKIICGMNPGYVIADLETEEIADIPSPGSFNAGAAAESGRFAGAGTASMSYMGMSNWIPKGLATGLLGGELLLAKDVSTLFIDSVGNPLEKRQIPWITAPEAIGFSYPHLLALQNPAKGTLEVRNPETLTLLQTISLPNATLLQVPQPNISLAHAGKGFLVASDRCIWRMSAVGYNEQIDELMEKNQLDEAISLLGLLEDALVRDKEGKIREAKMQKAQGFFEQQKFRESLDLFTEASAPPERVIRLYPSVISGSLSNIEQNDKSSDDEERPPSAKTNGNSSIKEKPGSPRAKPAHVKKQSVSSVKSPSKQAKNGLRKDSIDSDTTRSNQSLSRPLDGKDLQFATRELNTFLVDTRTKLQKYINPDGSLKAAAYAAEGAQDKASAAAFASLLVNPVTETDSDAEQKLRDTAKLVDTTLFKGYMLAQPSLAGPLFRLANFCDPDVVNERLLEKSRYNDLVDFFFGKSLHKPALELLKKFGEAKDEDPAAPNLHGPERTIAYLQGLAPEYTDLILEFARWPITTAPDLAMEIFVADSANADTLPRPEVLEFLLSVNLKLAVRYLEHVIHDLEDMTPAFHNRLVFLYVERLNASKGSKAPANLKFADSQDRLGWLGRLQDFLRSSKQYEPTKAFSLLPRDDFEFLECRAIVLSKMGQHKQALEIYVFNMEDYEKAEDYCNRLYIEEDSSQSSPTHSRRPTAMDGAEDDDHISIYHMLLSLYLAPQPPRKANWPPALELLSKHGPRLPALETLNLLPSEFPIRDLESYFRGRIRSANSAMNENRIVAGLRKVEVVDAQSLLLLGEGRSHGNGGRNRRVLIAEDRVCSVCHKRLGRSVISILPDNSVIHYGCSAKAQQAAR